MVWELPPMKTGTSLQNLVTDRTNNFDQNRSQPFRAVEWMKHGPNLGFGDQSLVGNREPIEEKSFGPL